MELPEENIKGTIKLIYEEFYKIVLKNIMF